MFLVCEVTKNWRKIRNEEPNDFKFDKFFLGNQTQKNKTGLHFSIRAGKEQMNLKLWPERQLILA